METRNYCCPTRPTTEIDMTAVMQDKLPQNVQDEINSALGVAREAQSGDDAAKMTEANSALQTAIMKIGESLAANNASSSSEKESSGTYDADVKDEGEKKDEKK